MRAWLAGVLLLVAGCSSSSSGGDPTGATAPKPIGGSCTGVDPVKSCQSMLCLPLPANAQNQSGICTQRCQDDNQCGGAGNVCVDVTADSTAGYCLRTCRGPADCSDGFACVPLDDPTEPLSVCFVQGPAGTGGAGGAGGTSGAGGAGGSGGGSGGEADCASKGCEIYTDPSMISGYCAMKPGTRKLCDCPTVDVPGSCTPTNPAAANLYCCP